MDNFGLSSYSCIGVAISGTFVRSIWSQECLFSRFCTVYNSFAVVCNRHFSDHINLDANATRPWGAATFANSNAITSSVFPDKQRARALGINATTMSLGIALGVTLGGYLIEFFGWQAIFFINLPFGIFGILLGLFVLLESRISVSKKEEHSMDYLGAVLSVLVIGGIMGGLELYLNPIAPIYFSHILLLLGLLLLPLLVFVELRTPFPLLDLRLYKIPAFCVGVSLRFLITSITYAVLFMIAFFTQTSLSYTPSIAGLFIIPFAVSSFIFGPVGGHFADKFGTRPIITIGFLIEALALFCFIMAVHSSSNESFLSTPITLIIGMFLHGIGTALVVGPNNSVTLHAVPPTQTGVTAGFLVTIAYLGGALGIAFCASFFPKNFQTDLSNSSMVAQSISHSQSMIFSFFVIVALVGAALSLIRRAHVGKTH